MTDGAPKDYSRVYCEDSPPPVPSARSRGYKIMASDGSYVAPKHREQKALDLMEVAARLEKFSKYEQDEHASGALKERFSARFRSSTRPAPPMTEYRTYIQYFDEKGYIPISTYIVRVDRNTLRAIKSKMPRRGNYRYFFKHSENTCEEIELDDAAVPFYNKDGMKNIYCQVFPRV